MSVAKIILMNENKFLIIRKINKHYYEVASTFFLHHSAKISKQKRYTFFYFNEKFGRSNVPVILKGIPPFFNFLLKRLPNSFNIAG